MTKKEYLYLVAIQALLKGGLVYHLTGLNQEYDEINNRYIKRLLNQLNASSLILDGFLEDVGLYAATYPKELGNLLYKAVIRIKLMATVESYLFHLGIRESDKYFFCDIYIYNPFEEPYQQKLSYFEELV